ncbi:25219_t:CDS:1, partial [Racocetra persica]
KNFVDAAEEVKYKEKSIDTYHLRDFAHTRSCAKCKTYDFD